MKLVLDIECTLVYADQNRTDPSPYNPLNSLISVGYQIVNGDKGYLFFHPNYATPTEIRDNVTKLQSLLDEAELVIGHNLKFDMSWLYETGFTYSGSFYDTMIFEYVTCKGQKLPTSLAFTAKRYGLSEKKDILKEWIAQKLQLQDMPKEQWLEYGSQDIETTYEVYQHQRKRYEYEKDVKTMWPVIKLTNEALEVLIDIERAGIQIDQEALDRVEKQFREERANLLSKMNAAVRDVWGDKPVNFASPDQMSQVVYSRKVKDKKVWAEMFGIGSEMRGSVRKVKYNKRYSPTEFDYIVRNNTDRVYRTDVKHCTACDGKGVYYKKKVNGEDWKKPTTCPSCDGEKVIYVDNGVIGGFRVKPISSEYATVSGFSTDKLTILELLDSGVSDDARDFLTCLARLNAIDTYLSSFVEGIRKGIRQDGFCHPNFNQCVTSTGRLSSSNPNWQNQPRGNTFPVRSVVVSRWAADGGTLTNVDFAQLEYRTAVMLAKCEAGLKSILAGADRHATTAKIIFGVEKGVTPDEEFKEARQNAKSRTFRPLYGGQSGNEREKEYNKAFMVEHAGIAKWHEALVKEALQTRQIVTPSGRIFAFPNVKRVSADRVTGKTQIVNYPVQSFATADIAWCVIIDLWRAMQSNKLQSKIILQVHDSVVIDTHPKEVEIVNQLVKISFKKAVQLLTERFKYDSIVPIGFEISTGVNLMEQKTTYAE
jgi:DNA polymerase I-like protein with 3'-5' exonuclease and polymerase domains